MKKICKRNQRLAFLLKKIGDHLPLKSTISEANVTVCFKGLGDASWLRMS